MERYMAHLRYGAEIRTQQFLDSQEKEAGSLMYGGIRGGVVEAKPTIYALSTAVAVYVDEGSRFYHQQRLYDAMDLALGFVGRLQREDGSFDFPSCNFKSAADTSFCFKRLYGAYRLLVRYDDGSGQMGLLRQKYRSLMRRALEAIVEGGFHTPNHRWGITAALMQGASLFEEEGEFSERLRGRARQYLAEGIDGDENGEYAERSTGNYNAVVNNAMMALFRETGDDSYLGYVRRNLQMMLYYLDPDDTVFTENSTRQDRGKQSYADKYFYQYLYLCSHEAQDVFDGVAHKLICDNQRRGDLAPDCYYILMDDHEMMGHHFSHYGFLESYRKFFPNSGVLRVKKPSYGYTAVKGKSSFLYVKSGSMAVGVKLGESYCDKRNFIPQNLEEKEDGCVLSGIANGWYYLPLKEPQGTWDWWKMDHSKREKLVNSRLETTVEVKELPDGLELTIRVEGLDRLPARLELNIPAGAALIHDSFWLRARAGEGMILREGYLKVEGCGRQLEVGPGFGEHEFQGHYSGEEENTTGYTVYCNAYTPWEKKFRICVVR
ncbi:MAG: hypothetical protein HFG61_00255 [Lachnospiraceae bacterium]|nr:hypothetical protein [Lachnospiraceae bacterium]